MTNALQTLTNKLAERFEMGSSENLPQTLMATAFKGQNVTPEQMTALLVVANQHGLNPWTNEIYAFPSKGAIIPIVGVDGWARIMNEHPQFDGIEFEQDAESCTCRIFRKDRNRPVIVTEYMDECRRDTQPWKSHPKRMLRHKAMIQGARLAFGFTGIYDQDEAERIVENSGPQAVNSTQKSAKSATDGNPQHPEFETLVTTLENIAEKGVVALGDYFENTLTKEQRQIVGMAEIQRIKAMATQYEQGTLQNAEFTQTEA
ncbi:phage recombination protein Bet [Mannheimia sp. HC-2023]|uniref:phage recombination protein Bet n=1 Tax=Mannheimia indoligenes TaxID=3103145 RepID=UPI002FE649D8